MEIDPLMLSYWIAIGSAVLMLIITLFVASKLRKTRKHGVVKEKESVTQISDLQSRFESLQDELKRAKAEFTRAHNEMSDLKEIEARANSEVHQLKRMLEAVSSERDSLAQENQEHKTVIPRLEEELKVSAARCEELQGILADKESRIKEFERQTEELSSQIQAAQTRLLYLQEEKESSDETISRQHDELNQAHLRIRELEDSIEELQSLKVNISARMQELEEQLATLREHNTHLEEDLSARRQELESLLNEDARLKNTLNDTEADVRQLTESNQNMEVSIQSLTSSVSDLQQRLDARLAELHRLEDAAGETISHQQEELNALTSERDTLAAEADQRQKQINTLEDTLKGMQAELDELKTKASALDKENHELSESRQRIEGEFDAAVSERGQLRNELRRQENLVNELRENNQNLCDELQEVKTRLDVEMNEKENALANLSGKERDLIQAKQTNQELGEKLRENKDAIERLNERARQIDEQLETARAEVTGLTKANRTQAVIIDDLKRDSAGRENTGSPPETADTQVEVQEESKQRKEEVVMEILLDNSVMKRPALDKAWELKKKFGGSLLRHMFVHRDIDENKLVECITAKFGVPYLPLGMYEIPDELIGSIPVDIVEKYWVLPLDKIENKLMVVMVDPFDKEAIGEIARITGCAIKVYVGILSEIARQIQKHYRVNIRGLDAEGNHVSPLFIATDGYKGRERRRAVRYEAQIPLKIMHEENVYTSLTEDICLDGLSFTLSRELPVYSTVTLQLNTAVLMMNEESLPVAAVAQVRRSQASQDSTFRIGVQFLKIAGEDIERIIKRVSENEAQQELSHAPGRPKKKMLIFSDDEIQEMKNAP